MTINEMTLLARSPEYDIQAGISLDFLNRVIALALRLGTIPSTFDTGFSAVEGSLGLTTRINLALEIVDAHLFAPAGADRTIGIEINYRGLIRSDVVLDEWTLPTPNGGYTDPGLSETFSVQFSGRLSATARLSFTELDDANVLTILFDQLLRLDIHAVPDLSFGADVNEFVRLIFERIAVVALRTRVRFPQLNGLAGALPAPLRAMLDTSSGEIGLLDLKIVGTNPTADADELHVLLQATQNLGQQSYALVRSFTGGSFDFGAAVTLRWIRQILQDLWIGRRIPRQFNDNGIPDLNGTVSILQLSVTFFTSSLQVNITLQRDVIGFPVQLSASFEVRPVVRRGLLQVDLINADIDLGLTWARDTSWSAIFFIMREVIGLLLLRAANVLLEPWALAQLEHFIESQEFDLRQRARWTGTPFGIDIVPAMIDVSQKQVLLGVKLSIYT